MATSVHAWLDTFGVEDVERLNGEAPTTTLKDGLPGGVKSVKGAWLSCMNQDCTSWSNGWKKPMAQTAGGILGRTGGGRGGKYVPIKLSDTAEKSSPFRSSLGNEMVTKRTLQQQSEQVWKWKCGML